jgi:prolyl oligopeptidase
MPKETIWEPIELPGIGTAGGLNGNKEDETLYYSFTNYHSPGVLYSYDPKTKISELYWKPEIDFNPDDYVSEQVFLYLRGWNSSPYDHHP